MSPSGGGWNAFWTRYACPVRFTLTYFLAAELGHLFSFEGRFASFWPPSGVFLGALSMTPVSLWPLYVTGAFVANIASDIGLHDRSIAVSTGFCLANSLDALVSAGLLRILLGYPLSVGRVNNVLSLVGCAMGGAACGAVIGTGVISWHYGASFGPTWLCWWISSLLGVLLVVPAVSSAVVIQPWTHPGFLRHLAEAVGIMSALGAIGLWIFRYQDRDLTFLPLPILVWAALRVRMCGALLAMWVITGVSVWCTSRGHGPFGVVYPVAEQVLLTQAYLAVVAILSLVLSALAVERKTAEQAVQAANDALMTANTRLQQLAVTDGLTGLNNRASFETRLAEEVLHARHRGRPLTLMIVDVDHFKSFNDTFGHPAGDEVLKEVSDRFRRALRSSDFVARYGGEEFAILLPGVDLEEARNLAERVRQTVDGGEWPQRNITVSIGVAGLREESGGQRLIVDADEALYLSKRRGRNRVSVCETGLPPSTEGKYDSGHVTPRLAPGVNHGGAVPAMSKAR